MIDPRLRYLIAIDREGSFSSAAKALSVTQSAVTKYVAELEKQIGYTLPPCILASSVTQYQSELHIPKANT